MRHVAAALICLGVLFVYGLLCLALGLRHFGGFIPVIALLSALGWLWRRILKTAG